MKFFLLSLFIGLPVNDVTVVDVDSNQEPSMEYSSETMRTLEKGLLKTELDPLKVYNALLKISEEQMRTQADFVEYIAIIEKELDSLGLDVQTLQTLKFNALQALSQDAREASEKALESPENERAIEEKPEEGQQNQELIEAEIPLPPESEDHTERLEAALKASTNAFLSQKKAFRYERQAYWIAICMIVLISAVIVVVLRGALMERQRAR